MRTTVDIDDDVRAAAEALRAERGIGLSEAINALARAGAAPRRTEARYVHRSTDLGIRVDVTDVGDVLDALDED